MDENKKPDDDAMQQIVELIADKSGAAAVVSVPPTTPSPGSETDPQPLTQTSTTLAPGSASVSAATPSPGSETDPQPLTQTSTTLAPVSASVSAATPSPGSESDPQPLTQTSTTLAPVSASVSAATPSPGSESEKHKEKGLLGNLFGRFSARDDDDDDDDDEPECKRNSQCAKNEICNKLTNTCEDKPEETNYEYEIRKQREDRLAKQQEHVRQMDLKNLKEKKI